MENLVNIFYGTYTVAGVIWAIAFMFFWIENEQALWARLTRRYGLPLAVTAIIHLFFPTQALLAVKIGITVLIAMFFLPALKPLARFPKAVANAVAKTLARPERESKTDYSEYILNETYDGVSAQFRWTDQFVGLGHDQDAAILDLHNEAKRHAHEQSKETSPNLHTKKRTR